MRFLVAALALGLAVSSARAELPLFARFTGTLQGETAFSGLPPLTWTLVAQAPAENHKKATALLKTSGLSLRVDLTIDFATETISWRIDDARFPLATLAGLLPSRFAPSLSGVTLDGEIHLSGSGSIKNNRPSGTLSVSCSGAAASHVIQGWTLSGIDFRADVSFTEDFAFSSASPATFVIKTIATHRFGARNFSTTATLTDDAHIAVTRASIEIAGGEVESTEPFSVPLASPAIDTAIRIRRVGLQDFVALIPSGLSDARGKLNGDLRLTWNNHDGIQLGIGTLALDEIEPTVIRLAPSPGFLTGSMPARIELLPGFLGRIFSVANPGLKDLQHIELGRTELEVRSLRIQLTPEGDSSGRSSFVQVDARPLQPGSVVKRVTFDINVEGPLSSLMRLGLNQPFTIQVR